ncbi:GntR family transcriptional regulator [Kaistia dalseonensis]|uniref:GntR family transcriptional regulator n=1 Tax=Kaistia dalseonensis TaxID=410840 RepID=A0ABU0H3F5_9HYPH|nr:GntR family transcriptional regulator [Kaistia dalseonensis]MCX5494010.1 GntR family transcriptional regulator [Kaistia dalseonensis]MDQ0436587.1 GntR family transcriptional regulator [Kaistia dalseonensis]
MRSEPIIQVDRDLIDHASPVPVFMQVEQDLRRQILNGALKSGGRLPRETELAKLYGISRMTVRRALEGLADARLVRRAHGVGTIVTPPPLPVTCDLGLMISFAEQLRRQGHEAATTVDMQARVVPPAQIRQALAIDDTEQTVVIRRVIAIDHRPIVMNTSWLPAALFPGLDREELSGGSLWSTLLARYDVRTVRADNMVELVNASADEARLLHVEEDAPLLRLTGTVFGENDRRLEYSTALWAGNVRFHFLSQTS